MDHQSPTISSPIDRDDDLGASMVEYALLVVLIAIVAFAAVQLAGNTLSDTYTSIADSMANASS